MRDDASEGGNLVEHADVLNATAAALRRLYGAASCSVALTVSGGTALRFVAADGEASDQVVGLELPVDKGIAGWVAMSQSQMAVADVTKDPRFARDVAELIGYMPTSILAAPLPGPDSALGVLEVLDADPARRGDLVTLALVGSLLAALLAQTSQEQPAPELAGRLARLTELGPSAVGLAARLLDAVVDTWEQA